MTHIHYKHQVSNLIVILTVQDTTFIDSFANNDINRGIDANIPI